MTPTNCVELLFDDVIWARKARQEHDAFVDLMRTEFGVDVMRVHELLQDVVSDPEGRAYILDRKLVPNEVGVGGTAELRAWMDEMDSATLTAHLIGGVTVMELPADFRKRVEKAYAGTDFVLPPLPNQLFTRDSSCWIYGGVTVNPMYWPARRKETLHLTAIYKYHPKFKGGDFNIWWGDPDVDHGSATLEGGDVMPIGNGVVLIGMGERTTYQAVSQVAQQLFKHNAAERVIAAKMPPDRASMHLDTIFSFCDRDLVTIYEPAVNNITAHHLPPRRQGRHAGCDRRGAGLAGGGAGSVGPEPVAGRSHGGRCVRAGARAVGRRQQRGCAAARCGGSLQPQRMDQCAAAQGGHHRDGDRRL